LATIPAACATAIVWCGASITRIPVAGRPGAQAARPQGNMDKLRQTAGAVSNTGFFGQSAALARGAHPANPGGDPHFNVLQSRKILARIEDAA
jgi:hypothetical protein